MKHFLLSILSVSFLLLSVTSGQAAGELQPDTLGAAGALGLYQPTLATPVTSIPSTEVFRRNIVKMNLSSLVLNNYSFSYERSLTRKITFVGGYRFMPNSKLGQVPLTVKLAERFKNDEVDAIEELNQINTSNNTLTCEFRFYAGKHAGARGFYLSLYGRYTNMKFNYYNEHIVDDKVYELPLVSNLNGIGGGLMIGSQWLIANRVAFDWYIIGAHYGKLSGNADAKVDLRELSASEKREMEEEIESTIEYGGKRVIDATVTDSGVKADINGPFLGIRGLGFSLGIAF